MDPLVIFLLVLLVLAVGGLPAWPYSTGWGYWPSGVLGVLFVVLLVYVVVRALQTPRTRL
jgi:membrane protein YdbS with pleckstrin-like domain